LTELQFEEQNESNDEEEPLGREGTLDQDMWVVVAPVLWMM
jgi:hypothetical protein